ncbi:hypothetical protein K1719_030536 [Acacia pycnantha]|nr:hypothetical protein K1719_030536 [Acacia pycnantha]
MMAMVPSKETELMHVVDIAATIYDKPSCFRNYYSTKQQRHTIRVWKRKSFEGRKQGGSCWLLNNGSKVAFKQRSLLKSWGSQRLWLMQDSVEHVYCIKS